MSLPNFLLSRVPLLSDPMDAIERALRFRASSSLNGTTSWGLLDLAGFSSRTSQCGRIGLSVALVRAPDTA